MKVDRDIGGKEVVLTVEIQGGWGELEVGEGGWWVVEGRGWCLSFRCCGGGDEIFLIRCGMHARSER